MSNNTNSRDTTPALEAAVNEFLTEQRGNYSQNLEYTLEKWLEDWIGDRDEETLADVSPLTMRHYASYLERRARGDTGIAKSTARTYYNYVSAFLSWAVNVEYLPENPAEKVRAKDPLPSSETNSSEQQFWTPAQRRTIMAHVDEQAREAIHDPDADALEPVRNRALVAVLAYTGVRGAEVLADHRVARRNGLRWGDVDFENGILTVFGKSQDIEQVPVPGQAVEPLRRLESLLGSPPDSWSAFPSRHAPSLYSAIDDSSHNRPDTDPWAFVLEHEIEPPSMSTSGVRTILKRLTDEADVDMSDSSKDYLTLHGARRGVGEKLYRERGAAAAQRTLRHADPKTTSQMYSHIDASELAADNTDVFDGE